MCATSGINFPANLRRAGAIIQQLKHVARSAGDAATGPTDEERKATSVGGTGGRHEWSELFTRPAHLYP
jgi:hypothetical protein